MLTTCLLLLSLTGAPTTGSQDQEPTCAELTKAYDKAALDWRRAQRAARKAKEDFEEPHPIQEYFGRFQKYADAGDPQAMLWIGTNVEDLGLSRADTAAKKQAAFTTLVEQDADDPVLMKRFLAKIDRQSRWLGHEEMIALLVPVFEGATDETQRQSAALKIAQSYERLGTDEGMAQAEAWYEKIIASFPDSKMAEVAQDQLVGMNVAVGRIAPDFETQDVDGAPFKLSDYRGKVVVIDFWGFW
jgi:hypothetical protein